MGGAPLLLALAVVTVDAGWESDGRDGYRYIIQLPAEQLREIERTGQITSQVPEALRGRIHSIVIQVGDDPLPRPAVEPRESAAETEPPSSELSDVATAGPASIYLPSPDETVRAQGNGDAFGIPTMEEFQQAGKQAAADLASQAERQLSEAARQKASQLANQARSSIHSGIDDAAERLKSRLGTSGSAAATGGASASNSYGTSEFRGFSETQTRATDAPSTSASSSDAPSTSRGSAVAPGGSPATGFAAADAPRDNRWNIGPTGSSSGSATGLTTNGPSTNGQTAQMNAAQSGTTGMNQSPSGNASGQTQLGGGSPPAAGGQRNASGGGDSASAGPSSGWAMPPASSAAANSSGSPNAPAASTPPSLSTPQNSPDAAPTSGFGDSGAGGRNLSSAGGLSGSGYGDNATTAGSRQEQADRRLLEEVGINSSGHAYDRRTNQLLYEDDPRYPLIVDYVRRTEQAEQDRLRGRDPSSARPPAAAVPSRPLYSDMSPSDYANPASRGAAPAGSDPWRQWGYGDRGSVVESPGGYASAPSYNTNQPYGGYPPQMLGGVNQVPPSATSPAGWSADPRLAQNPPAQNLSPQNPPAQPPAAATTPPPATETRQTAAAENKSTSSDRADEGKSREPSVTAQPLFNFMLLLSIVGNIYLGIAISRLIRRYRNLVSTQRGAAITA